MDSKAAYYALMREFARKRRSELGIQTRAFGIREIRGIYRRENIIIDIRKLPSCLRAIYLAEDGEVSVAIRKDLPDEPKLFALAHELKHHWVDQELIRKGLLRDAATTTPMNCKRKVLRYSQRNLFILKMSFLRMSAHATKPNGDLRTLFVLKSFTAEPKSATRSYERD